MPSMKNVIQKYNSKLMEDPKPTNNKTFSSIPLESKQLAKPLKQVVVIKTPTVLVFELSNYQNQ